MLCMWDKGRLQWISGQRAERSSLCRVSVCLYLQRYQCHTSHSPHSQWLQHSNIRKSHNWIVGREMSYFITVRAAMENLMLFSLYKIFVVRSCSHGPPKGAGGSWPPRGFWKFQQKKVVFLVSSGKKQISPLLAPIDKFWKNPQVPPLEKILPTPMVAAPPRTALDWSNT